MGNGLELGVKGNSDSDSSYSTGIVLYSDADFAGDKATRRSTSGALVLLGGRAVAWASKRQPVVALSTTEAELYAASLAGQEAVWLRAFLGELGHVQRGATPFMLDNQGSIELIKHPVLQSRAKHIEIKYFWLRDKVESGTFSPTYLQTDRMLADHLTKVTPRQAFENFAQHRRASRQGEC